MPHDFTEDAHEPETQAAANRGRKPPRKGTVVAEFEPPGGDRIPPTTIDPWIVAAIVLGIAGLILLFLFFPVREIHSEIGFGRCPFAVRSLLASLTQPCDSHTFASP